MNTITTETQETHDKDIFTLSLYYPMTKIKDNLFFGSMLAFDYIDLFSHIKIKHIISLRKINVDPWGIQLHSYYTSHKDFCNKFPKMIQEIFTLYKLAKESNDNIFIHCKSGQHRSATIVIAILMKFYDMDYNTAFDFTKGLRPCVEDVYIINKDTWTLTVNSKYLGYYHSRVG